MSGGSTEPESPRDVQCRHCGLFFAQEGVDSHEQHCDLQDYDATLVPLRGESPREESLRDEGETPPDESSDDVGLEGLAPQGSTSKEETVTDGGRAMDPPTFATREPSAASTTASDPTCPECDGDRWFDPADLPEQIHDAVDEDLRSYDRACAECSLDENGNPTGSVEVYNA